MQNNMSYTFPGGEVKVLISLMQDIYYFCHDVMHAC